MKKIEEIRLFNLYGFVPFLFAKRDNIVFTSVFLFGIVLFEIMERCVGVGF